LGKELGLMGFTGRESHIDKWEILNLRERGGGVDLTGLSDL
jgi:hypothetical protein